MAATTRENTCPRCGGLMNPQGPCPHCGWPEKGWQSEIKTELVKTITAFETERKKCLDKEYTEKEKGHEEFLRTGSGYPNPPQPRETMTCENNCPAEYGTDSCWCEPHILVYEYAKQLLKIIERSGEKMEK